MVVTVMIFRHTELKLYPMQKGEAKDEEAYGNTLLCTISK